MKYVLEITEDGYWFITTYFKTGYLSLIVWKLGYQSDVLGSVFDDIDDEDILLIHDDNKDRIFYEGRPITKIFKTNIQ